MSVYINVYKEETYLSLPVHSNDTASGLVWCGDKDGVTTNAVHVDAGASLYIIQVDVAILGDQEHNTMLGAGLQAQHGSGVRSTRQIFFSLSSLPISQLLPLSHLPLSTFIFNCSKAKFWNLVCIIDINH